MDAGSRSTAANRSQECPATQNSKPSRRVDDAVYISRCLFYIAVTLAIGACNLRRPEVTLTLAPIETRTLQATDLAEPPTETRVAQKLPEPTAQSSPTDIDLPTITDTIAPSLTAMAQPTPTATFEPTASPTNQPTPSETPVPSATETIPSIDAAEPAATDTAAPSATDTSVPTATPRASPTRILPRAATATEAAPGEADEPATSTAVPELVVRSVGTLRAEATASALLPTLTPLPTLDATELARLIATPVPQATALVTWTAVATALPSAAPVASTPLPASTTQGAERLPASTRLQATAPPQFGAATFTPIPTPTRFQPTVAVRQELIVEQIPPPIFAPATIHTAGASVYQYDVSFGQPFNYPGLQLNDGVVLFSPNPAAPGSYLRTDQAGMLWYRPIGEANEGAMSYAPFHEGYGVPSSELNKNRVVEIDWSADGAQFSFRIDPPPSQDTVNAGVWFWQPVRETPTDPTYAVIRDCVTEAYLSCQIVTRSDARNWKTINVAWSPIPGRGDILLTLELTGEGRQALAVVQALRDADYAKRSPEFFRYDYGHWNSDGSGIVVSGRRADGRVIIGQVNSDLRGERLVFDASSAGLWVQDAARRPNGQIVALGRPGGPYDNAPVSLYNSAGLRLSGPIGRAAPESVEWYADRSAVVVTVHGRQYTVSVDGGLITDSADLARNPAFGTGAIGVAPVPAAVIENSEYFPGQQLRAVRNLNLRQGPSTSHAVIGGLYTGDYVAILAGPYDNEGYRWWRVQTANNALGWIAGLINGTPTISP
ncbi:MAG: SH3 domain-containing protein [Chloroflexota bacterium]|nr:SH3 domain-containing protein [Chloroflexota bacterium]